MILFKFIFISLVLITSTVISAADFLIKSAADLQMLSTQLHPGDNVIMENGLWKDQYLFFHGVGTKEKPITLHPQTCGGVHLSGRSHLDISGNWLKVSCLIFENGKLGNGQHVVRFKGTSGEATNSELSNSIIRNYTNENKNDRLFWVSLFGNNNLVSHNLFDEQNFSGVTVVVWGKKGFSDNHLIEKNIFRNRQPGMGNGYESIRVGTSGVVDNSSGTVISSNLFEHTDGEIEAISIKSSNVQVLENVFREVSGTLTLRSGQKNIVNNNIFCANNQKNSGGIRVMGAGHLISGNQFYAIGQRIHGQIALYCGQDIKESSVPITQNIEIAENFFMNGMVPSVDMRMGCGTLNRTILPKNIMIKNNVSFMSMNSKIVINDVSSIVEQENIIVNTHNNFDVDKQSKWLSNFCTQKDLSDNYGPSIR